MNSENLVKQYLQICETQNKLNPKTIKAYKIDLEQFLEMPQKDLFYKKEYILKYIQFLNNKAYKEKTVKRKIACIKAFFSYLNYEDIIENNPFSKIKLKSKESFILPKTIPFEELNTLFYHLYQKKHSRNYSYCQYRYNVRDIAILEVLFGTGIRISELCNLRTENISIDRNFIKIYGKGAKERIIPILNKNIISALKEYYNLFEEEIQNSEFFFLNRNRNKISDQSIRNMISKNCKQCNIKMHITPHMFRHTFATSLLDNDVDIRHIQQILGHSSIITTQIYTHVSSNKKSEILNHKNPRLKLNINKG